MVVHAALVLEYGARGICDGVDEVGAAEVLRLDGDPVQPPASDNVVCID